MTVIAWDGEVLAADKRACSNGLILVVTKIFRVGSAIAGFSGDLAVAREVLAWMQAGEDVKTFPEVQRNRDKYCGVLVVRANGTCWKYEDTPYPYQVLGQRFAIGSGRDYAMAAMHLGKDALGAVECASALDSTCGSGVDVLRLDGGE